jgi:hypothetical protein
MVNPGCLLKIYVSNVRFQFQMEIGEKYVVTYLHGQGVKLPEIVAALARVFHEEPSDENMAKYWLHELKLHRSDLRDRPNSDRPSLKTPVSEFCKF